MKPELKKVGVRSCMLLLLVITTLLTRVSAQTIGASINESSVQDTYYVSTQGNNNTALKNDSNKPYRSIFRAFYRAHHDSIRNGRSAKVYIRNGTYSMYDTVADEKPLWPDADWGSGKNTLFIIEGESKSGVKINAPGSAFVRFNGKSNVVLRKFSLSGNRSASTDSGEWGLITLNNNGMVGDTKNVLVEQIDIDNADWIAMFIFRVDNTTIRHCRMNGGVTYPLKVYCRYSKFEDLNLNDNNQTPGLNQYGNGGFMFIGQDCEITRVQSSGDKQGYGFRMDHVAERVTLRDCTFNNNAWGGIIFETAMGPVNVINCTANNNGTYGFDLATAYDVTIDGCTFENNKIAAMRMFPMDRGFSNCPAFCMAGDLDEANWIDLKGMQWNKRTTVKNTKMVCKAGQYFYYCDLTGSWSYQYEPWVVNELTASNNTYIHENNADAFQIKKNDQTPVYTNLAGWQSFTGTDSGSTFTLGSSTGVPLWKRISLRSMANNKFVCADNYGNNPLIANRSSVGQWESFDVVDGGDGYIGLKAVANGKLVAADNYGNSPLRAAYQTSQPGTWERFSWIANPDGTISLKAAVKNKFVCADNQGSSSLIANRNSIGQWEKFTWSVVP